MYNWRCISMCFVQLFCRTEVFYQRCLLKRVRWNSATKSLVSTLIEYVKVSIETDVSVQFSTCLPTWQELKSWKNSYKYRLFTLIYTKYKNASFNLATEKCYGSKSIQIYHQNQMINYRTCNVKKLFLLMYFTHWIIYYC